MIGTYPRNTAYHQSPLVREWGDIMVGRIHVFYIGSQYKPIPILPEGRFNVSFPQYLRDLEHTDTHLEFNTREECNVFKSTAHALIEGALAVWVLSRVVACVAILLVRRRPRLLFVLLYVYWCDQWWLRDVGEIKHIDDTTLQADVPRLLAALSDLWQREDAPFPLSCFVAALWWD
jgi:hypothetical protein